MIYIGSFDDLILNGYRPNTFNTYYFKVIDRYGAIFIDTQTREITIESVSNPSVLTEELAKLHIKS